jgi:hypothetical protein
MVQCVGTALTASLSERGCLLTHSQIVAAMAYRAGGRASLAIASPRDSGGIEFDWRVEPL